MDNSGNYSKKYALRIYTIIKDGPLYKSGAKELTDFIIPPEEVITNQISFDEWVKTHSNQEIILSLYSLLTKKFRDVKIKTNPLGSKEGVLGASVQKENWTEANKKILHIISVKENSFAKEELGLIPYEDYIVGVKCKSSPIIPLNNDEFSPLEILAEVIRKNKGNPIKFYIYNKERGPRDITANIKNDYNFSLGCEGAFGALHMFPSIENEKNNSNNEYNNNEIKNKKEDENNINIISNNESDNKNENKDDNKVINLISDNKDKIENNLNKDDTNINTVVSNNNEVKTINLDNKNIDSKPSDNNINKIVEEISVDKELEENNSPKKEFQNELSQENKDSLDINSKKIVEENENPEKKKEIIEVINEEKKEEIKEGIKIENIKENKEEENSNKDEKIKEEKEEKEEEKKEEVKKEEDKKEDEKKEDDKKEEDKKEEDKKEEEKKEEDKKEEEKKEEDNKEDNKNNNNENSYSNNKNKRRRKKNKH